MRRFSVATVLGVFAIAATAYAAPPRSPEAWASGSLERVDTTAKSVVIRQGAHEMTFVVASDAHLMQGKKTLLPGDLTGEVGRQVKVRYTVNGGTKMADRIEVADSVSTHAANAPAKH